MSRGIPSLALTCSLMLVVLVAVEGRSKRMIFPGTKWCGAGARAESDDDLGRSLETDRCCRAHDRCPDSIIKHSTRHGLVNRGRYTLSHCDCDEEFLKCLKNAKSRSAALVGYAYFTVWNPRCFKKDFPAVCKKYSLTGRRCLEIEKDTSKPWEWQWFSNAAW
ncbi:phospholipase A2-like [Penaeus chinensis]|uniref:phospholipase A2-like n=1 Tax=Penaeus chinensis TaxID=139456 RepID=UPI001FB5AABE|nr:phospholipase A2-like [Penaeus chinensis]